MFAMLTAMAPGGRAPASPIAALNNIEKGQWEVRERGPAASTSAVRRICVGDPTQLLHVHHGSVSCRRFVVSDSAEKAAVTYQCDGQGNGRTDLRVETPRLVQIDAQGVDGGLPFSLSMEGRKTGECR